MGIDVETNGSVKKMTSQEFKDIDFSKVIGTSGFPYLILCKVENAVLKECLDILKGYLDKRFGTFGIKTFIALGNTIAICVRNQYTLAAFTTILEDLDGFDFIKEIGILHYKIFVDLVEVEMEKND